jgi:hypothetical protein
VDLDSFRALPGSPFAAPPPASTPK